MKDRRQLIYRILIIAMPLLIALVAIPMIYGWYVRVIRTGKIDGSTKNVSINYNFNDGRRNSTNSLTYTIDNLAFFDIGNENETSYFNSMAVDLVITLTNTSTSDMTYSITFSTSKRNGLDNEENIVSKSYVACYFKNISDEETVSELQENGTVSGNTVTYTETTSTYTAQATSAEYALKAENAGNTDVATIHLYLIGVQEKDSATNTDFLYSEAGRNRDLTKYTFTITIVGTPRSDSDVTEITTTTA